MVDSLEITLMISLMENNGKVIILTCLKSFTRPFAVSEMIFEADPELFCYDIFIGQVKVAISQRIKLACKIQQGMHKLYICIRTK